MSTTRRRFLAATALTAAAPVSAQAATKKPAKKKPVKRRADVVVVGAGFAGVTAARQVAAAGKSVYLLEARNRVGGRVLNADAGDNEIVEIGGQWIGPTQDRLAALAKEMGVETFPTYVKGEALLVYEGRKSRFALSGPLGPIPPVPDGLVDAATLIQKLDSMAADIPVDAPWQAAGAVEYDSQTFETFKQANTTTKGGRFLVDLGFASVFAAEPRDVSLLFTLFYCASAGNEKNKGTFSRLIATEGGAQESRFVGGSQRVVVKAAEQLGKRVVLGAPVRRIVQQKSGLVDVVSDKGTYSGREVIVAVPPTLAGRIDYSPQLSGGRDQLTQRMPMGTVIKCVAIYDKPFWRDDGLAGYTNADTEPVRLTFDNSPPDGSPGILLGFIEGTAGREWAARSAEDRRKAVLDNFATFYGEKARNPIRYIDMPWSEEQWSRGCYAAYTGPGVLLDHGKYLRRPEGRIKWAGTETATYWNGYIDGAVRSGERAAKEVLADL